MGSTLIHPPTKLLSASVSVIVSFLSTAALLYHMDGEVHLDYHQMTKFPFSLV